MDPIRPTTQTSSPSISPPYCPTGPVPQMLTLHLHHWLAGSPEDLALSLWCLLGQCWSCPPFGGLQCNLDGQFRALLPHWIAPNHRGLLSAGRRAGVWAQRVEMRRRQEGVWASSDFIVSGGSDGHGPPAGLCLSQGQRWPGWWAWRGRERTAGQKQSQSHPLAFPTSFPTTQGPGSSIQGRGCYPKLRNVHSPTQQGLQSQAV